MNTVKSFFGRLKAVPVIIIVIAVLTVGFYIFENTTVSLPGGGPLNTYTGGSGADLVQSADCIEIKVQPRGDGNIDINNATAEELDALPGIGSVRAKAIVEQREKMAGFTTLEDVMCTDGIGDKVFEKILPYIKIN